VFGGVLLFHPGWVVSSALAGLASGFGMGPGVSLPLWTAVTLFTFLQCPRGKGEVLLVAGCGSALWFVVARVLWVSFRPVSASSLNLLLGV
jgi:hypothetical protein